MPNSRPLPTKLVLTKVEDGYDLHLASGVKAEFTRDAHGFKFWALNINGERIQGDGSQGQRVPARVAKWLKENLA